MRTFTSRFLSASGLPSVITTSAASEQTATPKPASPDMPAPSSSTRVPPREEASGLIGATTAGRPGGFAHGVPEGGVGNKTAIGR